MPTSTKLRSLLAVVAEEADSDPRLMPHILAGSISTRSLSNFMLSPCFFSVQCSSKTQTKTRVDQLDLVCSGIQRLFRSASQMHSLIVANCVRHEEVQPHQFFVIRLASTRSGMEHKECPQQWHPAMAPQHGTQQWHPAMVPSNGTPAMAPSNGTPAMAPQQWHPASNGTQREPRQSW